MERSETDPVAPHSPPALSAPAPEAPQEGKDREEAHAKDAAAEAAEEGMGARRHTEGDVVLPNRSGPSNYSHGPTGSVPKGHRALVVAQAHKAGAAPMWSVPLQDWISADRAALGWAPVSTGVDPSTVPVLPLPGDHDAVLDKVRLHRGPVTALAVDGIVNAANEGCMGGGGVDGAVHAAAGDLLGCECATFAGCRTGHTRVTKGYNLPARYVLHTVGPMGEKPELLRSCYETCFELARRFKMRSVAFCCVSTGIFGYPLSKATQVALTVAAEQLHRHGDDIDHVVFACFTSGEAAEYEKQWPLVAPKAAKL